MVSSHPLDRFDIPNRILKRAQYEAFEFALLGSDVRIRNGSHACPSEHEYVVTIDERLPVACTCPADERFDYPCKHRAALVIRPPILAVATDVQELEESGVTDGVPVAVTP